MVTLREKGYVSREEASDKKIKLIYNLSDNSPKRFTSVPIAAQQEIPGCKCSEVHEYSGGWRRQNCVVL